MASPANAPKITTTFCESFKCGSWSVTEESSVVSSSEETSTALAKAISPAVGAILRTAVHQAAATAARQAATAIEAVRRTATAAAVTAEAVQAAEVLRRDGNLLIVNSL